MKYAWRLITTYHFFKTYYFPEYKNTFQSKILMEIRENIYFDYLFVALQVHFFFDKRQKQVRIDFSHTWFKFSYVQWMSPNDRIVLIRLFEKKINLWFCSHFWIGSVKKMTNNKIVMWAVPIDTNKMLTFFFGWKSLVEHNSPNWTSSLLRAFFVMIIDEN